MQGFLGGDKGGSSNPLKQISQREGQDRGAFRDRLAGPSTGPGPSSSAFRLPPSQLQHPTPASQLHANATPHPFNLSHLASALAGPSTPPLATVNAPPPLHFDGSWNHAVSQQQQHQQRPTYMLGRQGSAMSGMSQQSMGSMRSEDWASSYVQGQQEGKGKGRAMEPVQQGMGGQYGQQQGYGGYGGALGMGMGGMGMGAGMGMGMGYQPSFQPMYSGMAMQNGQPQHAQHAQQMQSPEQQQQQMEAAFDQAFKDAQIDVGQSQAGKEAQNQGEGQLQEPVQANAEEQAPAEEVREAKGDFEKVWESLKPEAERLGKLAEWEKEFSQFTNDEDDLFETLNDSLNRDDVGQTSLEEQMHLDSGLVRPDLQGYLETDDGVPNQRGYEYDRFASLSPRQAYIQAQALLSTGGSLTDSAHLLESFLQRATPEDYAITQTTSVESWSLLGRTHAMNEKEEKALSAFEQGRTALGEAKPGEVSRDVAGELLTNLAISYVNESLDLAALTVLHSYLSLTHPTTAGPAPSRSQIAEGDGPWALHQSVTDQYLSIAQQQFQSTSAVDPNLQVGLGTLYYMMGEYGEARESWVGALSEKPEDYLLWNRLGATLANGGNPEEAVDAYRRALELRPTFTRAIFNLGVACLNIGVHREAAEHFLAALALQEKANAEPTGSMYESNSLWATLRRSLTAMGLNSLAAQAVPGGDLQVFRSAGFDF